ncbi:hypothetical protein DAEQUDRAFT_140431 [Daedalea quercina L-15889]|uniref:Uncharacterized protein n=1 Tax=Daedalea quercina L-15889 TaxID=1314783 RepID=A0A165RU42_9APHY|nr:hypothetical protein DAEQUDRAFT_140431 [Daedalea quercina L-15889]
MATRPFSRCPSDFRIKQDTLCLCICRAIPLHLREGFDYLRVLIRALIAYTLLSLYVCHLCRDSVYVTVDNSSNSESNSSSLREFPRLDRYPSFPQCSLSTENIFSAALYTVPSHRAELAKAATHIFTVITSLPKSSWLWKSWTQDRSHSQAQAQPRQNPSQRSSISGGSTATAA